VPQAPEDHAAPGEPSAGGARPPFRPTQEIRFAVVLYGGVSLAIYINGVVQELLHLVRATAPEAPTGESPDAAWKSEAELTSTERVYRRLGQLLEWGKTPPPVLPGELAPIRTRFVVDILSGSSAGGINGVFLGKALANEQELAQLKQLWIDEGDIARLVNDKRSYDRLGLDEQRPPESVLNSRRLYWKLLAALDEMGTDGGAEASRLVDELDLWITTTDIRGLLMPIDLFDRMVYERRHRNVLHFKYATGYARGGGQGTDDGPVNDFLRSYNPMLAFAGRATSAFPFAFEPMTLSDIDQVLEVERFRHHAGGGAGSPRWRKFFEDYVRARRAPGDARGDDEYYRDEAFGDGGYLDNKPFTWATQAIARRRADLPVDRRLIYVEPDPGSLQPRVHPPGRPGTAPPPPRRSRCRGPSRSATTSSSSSCATARSTGSARSRPSSTGPRTSSPSSRSRRLRPRSGGSRRCSTC
jgi:patatin-related protein